MKRYWLIGLWTCLLAACGNEGPPGREALRVDLAMGGGAPAGFLRAEQPRQFHFPADHGPHDGFQHEWWYLTGNLETPSGRRFGYQFTLFRVALAPQAGDRPSAWAAHQVWMGHAALTDAQAGVHRADERFAREALGLAGARAAPFAVHLEGWRLAAAEDGTWQLQVEADEFALSLDLAALRAPVLQGEHGLSRKSNQAGNASYYYSVARLRTSGSVRRGTERHPVSGLSWLDREWSTSALGPDQAGWDWLSLQLDDGSDLMYYRLRLKNGETDPHSGGSLVRADGRRFDLGPDNTHLQALQWWQTGDGTRYPVGWSVKLKDPALDLRVTPLLPGQLMDLSVRYWEGAVEVSDVRGQLVGRGYLELAGYDASH